MSDLLRIIASSMQDIQDTEGNNKINRILLETWDIYKGWVV